MSSSFRPLPITSSSISTSTTTTGGRGRSKKRTRLYESLQFYHEQFLDPLTLEYQAEEYEIMNRITRSVDDPINYEKNAGYVLYDMYIERRGTLFTTQHVYRLTKAADATTSFDRIDSTSMGSAMVTKSPVKGSSSSNGIRYLPSNHKFSNNDVIVLTQQIHGSGDYYTDETLPIHESAITAEAMILSTGPTYIDIVMAAGSFETAFQCLPGNDNSGYGNKDLRLRVDHYISNVPYTRMVNALSQMTTVPSSTPSTTVVADTNTNTKHEKQPLPLQSSGMHMDSVIKDVIIQTFVYTHPLSPSYGNTEIGSAIQEMVSTKLMKPPMLQTSIKLAQQFLSYLQRNADGRFKYIYNTPQLAAIEAALTRRITLIQGPPGTGKTSVAAAIALGFTKQCQYINTNNMNGSRNSNSTKVLACAFSNVGADNLAEAMVSLGLKVVRVGKPSAVTESLWNYTLDAAIDQDVNAQKAMQNAIEASSQLALLSNKQRKRGGGGGGKSSSSSSSFNSNSRERNIRDAATLAVKASIIAANIAATKALRNADVIITTSIGAADARLLTACGILLTDKMDESTKDHELSGGKKTKYQSPTARGSSSSSSPLSAKERSNLAPDGLPPLSLPFVIVDEACQSIEPATLIPIVSSDSCRALVLLGDPCQLPPTVKSRTAQSLSLSLMERLAATLPNPNVIPAEDTTIKDVSYLTSAPVRDAVSLVRSRSQSRSATQQPKSYRKLFNGSILLSIQYRMHPSIAAIPSAIFYDGLLATPHIMNEIRSFPTILNRLFPCADPKLCVRLIDVGGRNNERQGTPNSNGMFSTTAGIATTSEPSILEQQTTYWNDSEAQRILMLLKDILIDSSNDVTTTKSPITSIGIISPYNGQVQLIKGMIANDPQIRDLIANRRQHNKIPISIEVKSVDGYQGRERDVIIVSTVRSNRRSQIGFVSDWRRMNVAITRAKSALLIVGDMQTISTADKNWDALRKWAVNVKCIVDDSENARDEVSV